MVAWAMALVLEAVHWQVPLTTICPLGQVILGVGIVGTTTTAGGGTTGTLTLETTGLDLCTVVTGTGGVVVATGIGTEG